MPAEQIDWLRAPSQSARSKRLPIPPVYPLLGRGEEGAGDDERQSNRLGFLFEPRGDVDGVAENRELEPRLVADRPAERLAGVQADAELDRSVSTCHLRIVRPLAWRTGEQSAGAAQRAPRVVRAW